MMENKLNWIELNVDACRVRFNISWGHYSGHNSRTIHIVLSIRNYRRAIQCCLQYPFTKVINPSQLVLRCASQLCHNDLYHCFSTDVFSYPCGCGQPFQKSCRSVIHTDVLSYNLCTETFARLNLAMCIKVCFDTISRLSVSLTTQTSLVICYVFTGSVVFTDQVHLESVSS